METAKELQQLEKIADDLNGGYASVIDKWFTPSARSIKSRPAISLPIEYTDTKALTRPARLGVGAKPAINQKSLLAESVFGNYKLKMQLSGQERLASSPLDPKDDLKMVIKGSQFNTANKKKPSIQTVQPDNDEDSRAKSIGKRKDQNILVQPSRGKRRK